MNFTHIILTKVNIKWLPQAIDVKWLKNRMFLFNNILRPSIEAQINKNFKFITLWGHEPEGKIDNEIQLILKSETSKELYLEWVEKILSHIDEDYVLTTRVDSDNALSYNFVDNLHKHVHNLHTEIPFYYDIINMHMLNLSNRNKSLWNAVKTSGFCSVLEKKENYECIPYKINHSKIQTIINGQKYDDLRALCTIHGENIYLQKESGKPAEFNEKLVYNILL